jgi:hypothetical protein
MKVSFDFDDTLTKPRIQKYVKFLISKGVEVYITTSRYEGFNYGYGNVKYDNSDLFLVANKLGIKQENIIFTNFKYKAEFLHDDFLFHVDDDQYELDRISRIKAIDVNSKYSIRQCNEILEENILIQEK